MYLLSPWPSLRTPCSPSRLLGVRISLSLHFFPHTYPSVFPLYGYLNCFHLPCFRLKKKIIPLSPSHISFTFLLHSFSLSLLSSLPPPPEMFSPVWSAYILTFLLYAPYRLSSSQLILRIIRYFFTHSTYIVSPVPLQHSLSQHLSTLYSV